MTLKFGAKSVEITWKEQHGYPVEIDTIELKNHNTGNSFEITGAEMEAIMSAIERQNDRYYKLRYTA